MSPSARKRAVTLLTAVTVVLLGLVLPAAGPFAPAEAAPPTGPITLVSNTSTWKYLDNDVDPAGTNPDTLVWTKSGFDDSAWKSGAGPWGAKNNTKNGITGTDQAGATHTITTLLRQYINNTSTPNTHSFFFRTTFSLTQEQLDAITTLAPTLYYDDAAILYLNGQKLAGYDDAGLAKNPDGTTKNITYGGSNADAPKLVSAPALPATALKVGTNNLSIALYNVLGDQLGRLPRPAEPGRQRRSRTRPRRCPS